MKKNVTIFITSLVLIMGLNAWGTNPLGPLYTINPTSGPVIDGDLGDLDKRGMGNLWR